MKNIVTALSGNTRSSITKFFKTYGTLVHNDIHQFNICVNKSYVVQIRAIINPIMTTLVTISDLCTGILPIKKSACNNRATVNTLCRKCHERDKKKSIKAMEKAVDDVIKDIVGGAVDDESFPYQFKNAKPNPFTCECMTEQLTLLRNVADNTDFLSEKCDIKIRQSNIPEWFTENLMIHIINRYGDIGRVKWCRMANLPGDMCCERYECVEGKSFTSNGPCSFGPDKKFDIIFFLDMRGWRADNWILWQVNLNNNSPEWTGIKMNSTETFADQVRSGRRPHISWDLLYPQIADHCVKIYDGSFSRIFKDS